VQVKEGRVFEVSLEANPTTGYLWEVIELDEAILQQEGEAEFKPESKLVGAPGVQTFRFKARTPGQVILTLVHHRPWEKDKDPLDSFSIQVVVR